MTYKETRKVNLLLLCNYNKGKNEMSKELKSNKMTSYVKDKTFTAMEAYAKATGKKFMPSRILVELAEMQLEVLSLEKEEFKKIIKDSIEKAKDLKTKRALKFIEVLEESGLELKEKES